MAVQHLNPETFAQAMESKVAMVDFWADWCQPCQSLLPVIDQLGDELDGKAVVGKVHVDQNKTLARQFGVMSIPTVVFFKDGKEVQRLVGVHPKQAYLDVIAQLA